MGHGIADNLLDDAPHIGIIDLDDQLTVAVLHDVAHAGLLLPHPSHLTVSIETDGEVGGLWCELNHVGIESGEEQDVVDEL